LHRAADAVQVCPRERCVSTFSKSLDWYSKGQSISLKKTGMTTFVIPAIYSWQFGDRDLAVFSGILDP
jgi:hypothetical protein